MDALASCCSPTPRLPVLARRAARKAEFKRKQAEERDDSEQFARMLIKRGRDPSNYREMYERHRNDMALEEAI